MEEQERYDLICKKRFDDLADDTKDILKLLRGYDKAPGLVDDVRDLQKINKAVGAGLLFILTTLFLQALAWLRHKLFEG